MPRKRPHESISGGEGGGSSSNGTNLANSNNSGRPPARSRHPPQNVMLGELELLLTPAAAVGEEDIVQRRNNNSGHNNQARISQVSGAIGGGGAAHTDSATFAMAQHNAPHMLDGRGVVAVDGRAPRVDNLAGISVAQPPTIAAGNNANNNNHNGAVLQRSIGGSGDGSGGAFGSAYGAVSAVPVWSVSSRGVNGSVSSLADGSEMVHAVGQPLSLRSTVGLGIGGGLEALPRRVREAVAQVNAQQLQRMASKQPEFATVVPPIAESGFSNIHWLLLEWTADMVMNRIVGLVVLAGPFTTQSDISGFDVRLIFDQQNMDHELAMHGWQECVARMNNISPGQIVEFTRLKVREQGRNGNVKGSFPFTLLYNGESRHRVLGQAPAAVTNAVCSPNFNTPIIVEANDQHQHSSSNGTIIGGGERGGNDLNNPSNNDSADNDALPAQLTNRPDQVNISDIGDEQRLLIQSNDEDAEEDDFDRAGHSGGGGSSTMSNGALFSAMAAPGTVVVRNEDSGSSSCNAWRQIGRGRPPITNRSGNDDNTSGSNSETAAVTTVSANSGHSDDRAGARDSDAQRLDSFCKVIGAWERTECRSRNTRCEAVEVSLRGWEGARRPDTLLARCIEHLLQRVLSGRAPPMRIGMSCQPPQFASPYHIPHRAPEQNTPAAMGAELERLAAQSAGGVDLFGGTVLFRISAVWPLDASGQSGAGACAGDEQEARGSVRCRSFFPVVNPGDRWCLARAIVLGLADRRAQLQYGAGSVQAAAQFRAFWLAQHGPGGAQAARQLLHMATLPLDKQDYGVADAQRLQQALDTRLGAQQVRLVIFEREHGCRVLWKGAQRAHFNICLLLQQGAHYGYIQRPAQLFRAKQFCVECEHPVDRRTHPLGCRAVCGLCMRYDELRFPCRRQGGDGSSGTFCQQCRFVFPNADCFEAHRRRVDVPPAPPPDVAAAAVPHGAVVGGAAVAPAFADRRRGRPHRSMCEERRLCEWCNVVVWARSGPHVCRRRPQHQQQQEENRAVLQQQQQQNHHNQQPAPPKCEKCGGPHDPERTPHFIQPKQYARQCQWRRGAARGAHDNADDGAVADAAAAVDDDDDDDVSEEEGAEAGAARGGVGDGARGRLRKPKPVRFIFWDVECAQERVGEQQEQADEAEAAHGAGDEAGAMDAVQQQQQQLPELLKHVPVLVCAEVICERCIAYGVDIEREPLRRAPQCQCGVPWRGANRRRWCSRIGEEQFDDDTNGPATAQQQQQQMPPDGLNPRRLRFFCDGEPGTGRGAMAQFVDFLLHTGPKGTRTVMLAHNGGRYDVHLLLEELQRRGERPKKAVQHGLRVYMLELRGTHQRQLICKDSLNFFHAALATLPRTFGLRGVLDKPFFPYHHIREQNLDVELPAGTLPPPAAYDPDRMRAAQRADFMTWYERELHRPGRQPFVLRRELLRYCWNDVRILRAACLRFRELVGECADGMEPFLAATTIASLAMAVFRQHHLRPHTMVHTPEGGFLRGRRASAESRRFFALLAAMRPDLGPLRTARWSVGEMVMDNSSWGGDDDGFRLDCVAYRRPPLRPLCIEFNGCYMHGCRECYPERQMVLAGGRSAELLWARTQQRAWELAELHGMQVQSVWECQFRRMLRNSPRMRKLYKERCVDVPVPLDLRKHALFGGRVEPFWLLYSCAPDEEIVYIDIVSLYPFCMKTRPFPIGTPRVWTGEQLWQQQPQTARGHPHTDCAGPPPPALRPPALPWCRPEDNPFRGFLFCRVLPPSADELGDREPLLPYRTQADGRLTFGLCARCAELRHQRTCRHTERERAWTAAYTHVELNRALLLGYRVLQVHEVWHYDQWASPESGNGLFNDYVNTFLRLKAEASGWPAGCDDEAARAEHVRLFAEQEGVHLRHDNIGHNPGLRQLAKDLLNSLWGKMAERPERDEVVYTDSARAFHELLMDARQEVVSFTHINEQLDRCVVRKREPFARAPEHNNLAVACFVTSHARLYLYEWLEEVRRVGGRALYCDTDSVLYVRRLGAPCVREGNALGDMKRELPGRRIIDFFAAGPKNYGFQHVDARTGQDLRAERKVRSFELTYAADQQLQYGRMRQLVINHFGRPEKRAYHGGGGGGDIAEAATEQRTIAVSCQRFVRSQQADIFTRRSTRVYRPVYTKGRVLRPPTAGGEAAAAEEQAEAVTPAPLFIRTRPFGWCSAEAQQMETDDDDDEEEEDEEAAAISDDDGGESDGMGQPVRKRARAEPVEEMLVEVEEQAAPPPDPDLEEEPVAGCSTWNQQRRLNEHIFRN